MEGESSSEIDGNLAGFTCAKLNDRGPVRSLASTIRCFQQPISTYVVQSTFESASCDKHKLVDLACI